MMPRKPVWSRWVVSTLSALTAIVVILWVVSHVWVIEVAWPGLSPNTMISIGHRVGCVTIMFSRYSPSPPPSVRRDTHWTIKPVSELRNAIQMARSVGIMMDRLEDRAHFEWSTFTLPPRRGIVWSGRTIVFPYWLVTALCGAWPVWAALRWYHRRTRPGRCRSCGYDLRASPSGVCPECGQANFLSAREAYIARWEARQRALWKFLAGCFFIPPVILFVLGMISELISGLARGGYEYHGPPLWGLAVFVMVTGSLGLISGLIFYLGGIWRLRLIKSRMAREADA